MTIRLTTQNTLGFLAGVGIGALLSFAIDKLKSIRLEENFEDSEEQESEEEPMGETDEQDDIYEPTDDDLEKYHNIVQNYSKDFEKRKDTKPVIVDEDEVSDPGEYDSYNVISLSFFSDGTVAYENGETVDDIDSTVGAQALFNLTMGMDIVHVRNDRLRCFFEITSDLRTYFEAFGEEACV